MNPSYGTFRRREAQFGMVTSVFLLIYALLSPVGGFLADRYSRRLMILCSLVVWSVVTWWTGHAEDYTSCSLRAEQWASARHSTSPPPWP